MAGGGGDGGYAEQQAAIEAKKQAARDALNIQFGIRPTGGAAPSREQFTTYTQAPNGGSNVSGDSEWNYNGYGGSSATPGAVGTMPVFDQAGFDAATAAWNGRDSTADANAAAREALYGTVRTNAFDAGKRKFDEDKTAAGRNLKFELFAKGLNGGSVDVDQNALLGRTYDQGILDLGAKADGVRNDLKTGDESTRLNLLQSIDAGMDQGSALSSALQQMQNSSDRAAANAQGTALGDLFGSAGLVYSDSEARKGRQTGLDSFAKLLAGTRSSGGASRSTGSSGVITGTGG